MRCATKGGNFTPLSSPPVRCLLFGALSLVLHLSAPAAPRAAPPPAPPYRQKPSATGEEGENAARCPAGSAGLSQIFSAAIESAPYEAPEVVPCGASQALSR